MVIYLGSLVQLCCREGGTLQTNITGMCGECSQYLGHTGFAPAHGVCAFLVYTAQAPGYSAGELSKRALGCMHFPGLSCPGSGFLGYSTKAQTWLGLRFVPFPGLSSSGDQVLGEHTLPRSGGVSYHLPGPSCWVFCVCSGSAVSGVPCVSSGDLISGCNPPGGCQPSRIPGRLNWEPACSLVEDAISGTDFAPCLLALAVTHLPPCLRRGMGRSAAS